MYRTITFMLIVWISLFATVGCSNTETAVTPDVNDKIETIADPGNRTPLGVLGFRFDEASVELLPIDLRQITAHYDVSSFIGPPNCQGTGCLTYIIKSWDPATRVLDVDAKLKNPTALTAYDARLIFLGFVNRKILNVDSYTTNYDPGSGINPFIAFGKANPSRAFGPSPAEFTENIKVHWPAGSSAIIVNVVDASWPGHCPEPYEINNITAAHMITAGSVDIYCDVLDWQSDVDWVKVDTTPITGGWTSLTNSSGNTWTANITNTMSASIGDYACWIKAHSSTSPTFTELYHKITIKIRMDKFVRLSINNLPATSCSIDLGVVGSTGSSMDSHILTTGDDVLNAGSCDAIDEYTKNYASVSMYTSLAGLDTSNNTYQPWPVKRIDVTNDGAAGWSNSNTAFYNEVGYTPAGGVANSEIYSTTDRNGTFIATWPADHRHFDPSMASSGWAPVDVCDGFDRFQYSLMINYSNDARPMGFEGRPHGDYKNIDIVYYTSFAANSLIGAGPGKIEPGNDIAGIDAYQLDSDTCRLLVVENGAEWVVEAFDITNDIAGWGFDSVTWQWQAILPNWAKPIDVELLPMNPDFIPCPDAPIVCVLVELPTYGGGCVFFYNAINGNFIAYLGALGYGLTAPPITVLPIYMDTDDGEWEIHVVVPGPAVHIFKWV